MLWILGSLSQSSPLLLKHHPLLSSSVLSDITPWAMGSTDLSTLLLQNQFQKIMLDASLLMPSSYRSLLSMILLWPSHLSKTTTSVGNSNARSTTLIQTLQRMPSLLPMFLSWGNGPRFLCLYPTSTCG